MRDAPQGFAPLGRDDLPILVVVGSADQLIGQSVAESLAAALGGAQLIRIQEAGHFSNLEKPDAFNQALRTFLEGLGPI
jgi:pimeloyl-ACP methyl ester carboxylesterase